MAKKCVAKEKQRNDAKRRGEETTLDALIRYEAKCYGVDLRCDGYDWRGVALAMWCGGTAKDRVAVE